MSAPNSFVHLTDGTLSVVLRVGEGMPEVAHWGAPIATVHLDPRLFERGVPDGGLDLDPPHALVMEPAAGGFAAPGVVAHRADGRSIYPRFTSVDFDQTSAAASFSLVDSHAAIRLTLSVGITDGGVATFDATLTNTGTDDLTVEALRLTLPVPEQARELLTVGGRWTNEFGQTRTPWVDTCLTVENRRGKTGHERLGAIFAGTSGFGESHGEVWGVHIGWSGNFELRADAVSDARRSIQVGELLTAGEISLAPGESYSAPRAYAAWSGAGLNGVSQRFHRFLRARPNHPTTPRPVIMNTWEAVYFDHHLDRLKELATRGAAIGIERYVLDDGWFHARRHDRAGLGDWWVDPKVWPDGLHPLIEHVRGLGMEFGLWVEPEMVNPDSDLYRAHPEWTLHDHAYPLVLARNQLALDLGRPEVRDYLFDHLDALLRDHDISYLKWDMNRDLAAPTTSTGRGGVHAQTLGVYELIDRLRGAHPTVEIESCASGGGRFDFGILERTDRVWTSDSIDALDRQVIQRGFSLLAPPELMGCHIGAPVAHTTHRHLPLSMRAASAFFGHLGVEWNLLSLTDEELAAMARIIVLHKEHRALLHGGVAWRYDHPDPRLIAHGVVATDGSSALVSITRLASGPSLHTAPLRIWGLDPTRRYTVQLLDLAPPANGGHRRTDSRHYGAARRQPDWVTGRISATGEQLAVLGIVPPIMHAASGAIILISAAD